MFPFLLRSAKSQRASEVGRVTVVFRNSALAGLRGADQLPNDWPAFRNQRALSWRVAPAGQDLEVASRAHEKYRHVAVLFRGPETAIFRTRISSGCHPGRPKVDPGAIYPGTVIERAVRGSRLSPIGAKLCSASNSDVIPD